MAARLFRAVGRAEMIDDPRFATNAARVRNAEECERPIADFIAARDFAEVMAIFQREEITAAPVYDVDQLLDDPHVIARAIISDLPDAEMGRVPMHAVVPRLGATPGAIRTPAPGLGEHTREVLAPLAGEGLDALAARGVMSDGTVGVDSGLRRNDE